MLYSPSNKKERRSKKARSPVGSETSNKPLKGASPNFTVETSRNKNFLKMPANSDEKVAKNSHITSVCL
jgi:hypothetical protein